MWIYAWTIHFFVVVFIVKCIPQVFRFDERTSKFKPYESLASYGVVAQEQMRIGDDLYLLLLSEHTRTLDVYEYIFSEVSKTVAKY